MAFDEDNLKKDDAQEGKEEEKKKEAAVEAPATPEEAAERITEEAMGVVGSVKNEGEELGGLLEKKSQEVPEQSSAAELAEEGKKTIEDTGKAIDSATGELKGKASGILSEEKGEDDGLAAEEMEEEDRREIMELIMENFILQSKKINEGNNGIIKALDLRKIRDELPLKLVEYITKKSPDFFSERDDLAIKMLKVYNRGDGKREFEAQKRAHEIITKEQETNPEASLAGVPTPLIFEELTVVDEETQAILKNDGLKSLTDKVEILIMDLIPGEDMATHIYEEVVKRSGKLAHLRGSLEEIPLNDLIEEVSSALGFVEAGGKHRDEDLKVFEEEAVRNENVEKIVRFLKQSGFTLDKDILNKVENTIKLLHKNGLYHRDLHERNIMMVGDEVKIIDFGSAKEVPAGTEEDMYEEGGKRLVPDEMVLERYKPLTTTFEEDQQKEVKELVQKLDGLKDMISKRRETDWQRFQGKLEDVSEDDLEPTVESLARSISPGGNDDLYVNAKSLGLLEVSRTGKADMVKALITRKIKEKTLPPYEENRLRKLLMVDFEEKKKPEAD